ncbi:hypothetical protein [Streptomyces hyaluromycini]|uniref:hypothetical protein n=1 Tax=Streptomyces hyaluromycini TaxID=1377993 RepID=UPI0011AE1F0B|nr:hypothetical protein [Streptomyces hyaluromycini]
MRRTHVLHEGIREEETNVYGCRAPSQGRKCDKPSTIKAEWAEEYVARKFLGMVGSWEVIETRKVAGYDPGPEINEVSAELEEHMKQSGRFRSEAGRRIWEEKATALETRLAELEATPRRPPSTEVVRTGRTYADTWHAKDDAGRRRMLLDAGALLTVGQGRKGSRYAVDEARFDFQIGEHGDPEAEQLADILAQERES